MYARIRWELVVDPLGTFGTTYFLHEAESFLRS